MGEALAGAVATGGGKGAGVPGNVGVVGTNAEGFSEFSESQGEASTPGKCCKLAIPLHEAGQAPGGARVGAAAFRAPRDRQCPCDGVRGARLGMLQARGRANLGRWIGRPSTYDLNMRERIEGRITMKGAPSGSGAGTMNAPFSSFFMSVRSPLESVE